MFTQKHEVLVCEVIINCPGIPTYKKVRLLPAVGDPTKLVKSDLKKQFKANGLELNEDALQVEIKEIDRKVIFPIVTLLRYCSRCKLTAKEAGVENEEFVHCGKCGKPTDFVFQDPE